MTKKNTSAVAPLVAGHQDCTRVEGVSSPPETWATLWNAGTDDGCNMVQQILTFSNVEAMDLTYVQGWKFLFLIQVLVKTAWAAQPSMV